MTLLAEYRDARRDEDVARLRRVIALRAMVATGMSQQQVGDALGISQPAVSQQLRYAPDLEAVRPDELLDAAAPVLKALAARPREGRCQSPDAPPGTSSFAFIRFKQLIEKVLGREIDLISYGGLKPKMDDDIRRDAVLL